MTLGMATLAAYVLATQPMEMAKRLDLGFTSYTTGDRAKRRAAGSIAKRNRWTGLPHEDKRAMARLARQEAQRNV